jgi:hypothetical protein
MMIGKQLIKVVLEQEIDLVALPADFDPIVHGVKGVPHGHLVLALDRCPLGGLMHGFLVL